MAKDKDNLDNPVNCSKVMGLAVFSVNEGQNVGFVKKVLMELADKKSLVFLIEDNEWYKGAKVLKAADVMKIGQEALVIESSDKLTPFSELPEADLSITRNDSCHGKLVVDDENNKLGNVKGCLIDRNTIGMQGVVFETEDGQEHEIPSEQIVEVKRDAIVISQEPGMAVAEDQDQESEDVGRVPEELNDVGRVLRTRQDQTDNGSGNGHSEEQLEELEDEDEVETGTMVEQNVALDNVTKLERPAAEDEHVQKTGPVAQKSLKEILEERQDKFLLGKKVDRDIMTDDGSTIIKKDEVITEQVLKQAKDSHKYIVLSFCIKRS